MGPLSLDLRERVVTAIREGYELSGGGAAVQSQLRQRNPLGSGDARTRELCAAYDGRRHPLAARGGARRLSSAATPAGTGPDAGRNLRAVGARAGREGFAVDDLALLRP